MTDLKTNLTLDNDTLVVQHTQDISGILDHNRDLQANTTGYSETKEMKHIASIPMVTVMELMKKGINVFDPDHMAAVKRVLNDPAFAYLRTSKGRV